MALGNNNTAIFLSIADGKIVRRFKDKTANSQERTITKGPNAGKVVHEERYSFVEGNITDITTRESEYGKTWNVNIQDGSDSYVLQMDYSGGYSSAFLKALPNVDFSRPVKLSPKMTIEGDKKRTTLFVNQGGTACKHAFTKDNPNGLPQMVQVKVKGVMTWDDTDMMEFLENMVQNDILPKIKGAKPAPIDAEPVHAADAEHDDDLPF